MSIYKFSPDDARRFAREQNIPARQRGNELHFKSCPYCGGVTKDKDTFAINLDTGQFKCLRASCGAHGNMITLAKDFNFSLGDDVDEYFNQRRRFRNIHRKEKAEIRPRAVTYLESRGIPRAITERYEITTQKDRDNILVFPFYDENNILQFVKYRDMDYSKEKGGNKEWCEKDCKPVLFGMNHINVSNKTLVLTEGQIDSLSCAAAGIENAVSVPTGAKGFTWVPYCWDFLKQFDTLIVFGDYENGKITLLTEMRERFEGTIKHVRPEDYLECKDANEILKKHSPEGIRQAIKNAVPIRNPRIKPLEEVKRVNINDLERFSTGFDQLDRMLGGFFFGQLILVTGERGLGKSTLVSQFATLAVKNRYSVIAYSGELNDWQFQDWFEQQCAGAEYVNAINTGRAGFKAYRVDGNYVPAIERWYSGYMFVYDNGIFGQDKDIETEKLVDVLEESAKQYGCRVIIVDNLMTAMDDDLGSDLYRQQSNFTKRLALMAKRYNALIFLIAHPRKSSGREFSNDDIAGSGNITNLADVVLRFGAPDDKKDEDEDNERVLQVLKNRLNGRISKKGIPMFYQEASRRISENQYNFGWKCGWEDAATEWEEVGDMEELPF